MKHIFFGMFLIFLSVDFEFGARSVDLLPDFLGYLLILRGLTNHRADARAFELGRIPTFVMLLWSLASFGCALLAVPLEAELRAAGLGLLWVVLELAVLLCVALGFADFERTRGYPNMKTRRLLLAWAGEAITLLAAELSGLFGLLGMSMLTTPALIGALLFALAFLRFYYDTWQASMLD